MATLTSDQGTLIISVPAGSSLRVYSKSGTPTVSGSSVSVEDVTTTLGCYVYGPQTSNSTITITTTGVLVYDIVAGDPTPTVGGVSSIITDPAQRAAVAEASVSTPAPPAVKVRRLVQAIQNASTYTVMTAPPTVTKGTAGANSTVVTNATVSNPTVLPNDSRCTPLSGTNISGSSGSYAANYITETNAVRNQGWGFAIYTDAEAVDLCLRDNASTKFKVRIDGQWTSSTDYDCSGTGSNFIYNKIDFGTGGGKPRLWEFFFSAGTQVRGLVAGVSAGSTAAANPYRVWTGRDTSQLKAMFFGDSYVYGVGLSGTSFVRDSFVYVCGEALGISNPIASGAGGQGYLTASNGSALTARQRINDTTLFGELDLLVVSFGINDSAQDATALQAEATTTLAALRDLHPRSIIVVTCFTASGKILSNTRFGAIKAAFGAVADATRMVYVDTSSFTGENWFDTSGGNSAIYDNQSDTVHKSNAGHAYLGRRLAASVAAWAKTISP